MFSTIAASVLALSLLAPQDEGGFSLRPEKVTLPDEAIEVEMKMRGAMPAVEVMVNGAGPFLFAIDTGGQGAARADVTLVEELGLETFEGPMGSDGSGRAGTPMLATRLEVIEFGGARFEGVPALSRDYNRSPSLPKIHGMLGIHLFESAVLTLDYPGRKVRVEKGPVAFPEGAHVLKLTSEPDSVPTVPLEIGDLRLEEACLDSGMIGSIGIHDDLAAKLEFWEEPRVVGKARTVSGEFEIKQGKMIGPLLLGGVEVTDPSLTIGSVMVRPVIGSAFFASYRLTIDHPQRRVWIRTPEREAELRAAAPLPEDEGNAPR